MLTFLPDFPQSTWPSFVKKKLVLGHASKRQKQFPFQAKLESAVRVIEVRGYMHVMVNFRYLPIKIGKFIR